MKSTRTSAHKVVGLDIEPGHLAAAEVTVNGAVAVERAATAPLDGGVMRDGEVADGEALTAALKSFFDEHGLGRRVRLGLANQRIVVRKLELPPLKDANDLDAAIRFQAQEQIPMPLEQAVVDYRALGVVETEAGPRTQVVLVAARRDMVARLLSAARDAGLRPVGIDLSAFAMIRALGGTHAGDGAALYANVAGMTNVAIGVGSRCDFTRAIPGGLEAMVIALAERRALTLEHARKWLGHVGLQLPVESIEGEPEIVAEARTVLADGARRVGDEVRSSLDYYRGQERSVPVERAVLTGPAATIPGFADQLGADVGIQVEVGAVGEARPGALAGLEAARITIAAGLAVEERQS